MAKYKPNINDILDIPLWQSIQDCIAAGTGVAVIAVDCDGNPITKLSGQTEYCRAVRSSGSLCSCDKRAGLEALRLERPYVYTCSCGTTAVAVPVLVDGRYLGALIFGQIRIRGKELSPAKLFPHADSALLSRLEELAAGLPEYDGDGIRKSAGLLECIVRYIVERTAKDGFGYGLKYADINAPAVLPVGKNSSVYPAVEHIHAHLRESISMKSMAELCHLSPSYFSRIFTREVGENFVSYTNRQKISLSRRLLRETSKSVGQISAELGFQDTSHFISLFKRYEGVTPTVYRQMG